MTSVSRKIVLSSSFPTAERANIYGYVNLQQRLENVVSLRVLDFRFVCREMQGNVTEGGSYLALRSAKLSQMLSRNPFHISAIFEDGDLDATAEPVSDVIGLGFILNKDHPKKFLMFNQRMCFQRPMTLEYFDWRVDLVNSNLIGESDENFWIEITLEFEQQEQTYLFERATGLSL